MTRLMTRLMNARMVNARLMRGRTVMRSKMRASAFRSPKAVPAPKKAPTTWIGASLPHRRGARLPLPGHITRRFTRRVLMLLVTFLVVLASAAAEAQPERHLLVPSVRRPVHTQAVVETLRAPPSPRVEVIVVRDCRSTGTCAHAYVPPLRPPSVEPPQAPRVQVTAIGGFRRLSVQDALAPMVGLRVGLRVNDYVEVGYRFDYTHLQLVNEYRGALDLRTLFRPNRILRPVLGIGPWASVYSMDEATYGSVGLSSEAGIELQGRTSRGTLRVLLAMEWGAGWVPSLDLVRYDVGLRAGVGFTF